VCKESNNPPVAGKSAAVPIAIGLDAEYFPDRHFLLPKWEGWKSLTTSRANGCPSAPEKQSRIKTNTGFMDVLIPISPTL